MITAILDNQIVHKTSLPLHTLHMIYSWYLYIKIQTTSAGVLDGVSRNKLNFADQHTRFCVSVLPRIRGELQFLIYKMGMMIRLNLKALLKIR